MIGVAIIPQPNTNAIAIADEFYKRLVEVKGALPPDIQADIGYDFTTYVRKSVTEVEETLLIAFLLVAFIIFAFLRDWRATLIPVVTIPVSIVSAFFIMYLSGFSINVLTLVGLSAISRSPRRKERVAWRAWLICAAIPESKAVRRCRFTRLRWSCRTKS